MTSGFDNISSHSMRLAFSICPLAVLCHAIIDFSEQDRSKGHQG